MKRFFLLMLIVVVSSNVFAGLKDDYKETVMKLTNQLSLAATREDLKKFEEEKKSQLLSILNKYKDSLTDEEKIIAARIMNDINKPEKALSYLKGVKVSKKVKNFYYTTLGETYFLLGKYKKAINSLEKADITHPRVALDFINLGFGMLKEKRYSLAKRVFKKLLSPDIKSIRVRYFASVGLMEYFEMTGKVKDGIDYFTNTLKNTRDKNRIRYLKILLTQLKLINKKAPEIKNIVLTYNADSISIEKNRGKYTLLFFFAGKSMESVFAMPYISGISEDYKGSLTVIGINLFPKGVNAKGQKNFFKWYILQNKKMKYPVAILKNDETYRDYGVGVLPHFVLINPDGKVEMVFTGFQKKEYNPMLVYLKGLKLKKHQNNMVKSKRK